MIATNASLHEQRRPPTFQPDRQQGANANRNRERQQRKANCKIESPAGEGLFRSLIAAATENEDVGRRLREALADPRLFTVRLREAREAGILRADLPIEDVSETLIGALTFRALARTPSDPGFPGRVVDLVLGPAPV